MNILVVVVLCWVCAPYTHATELTFELDNQSVECFHERLQQNVSVTLEFQVVQGDVNCSVEDPAHNYVYRRQMIQFDSVTFTTDREGEYSVCFSNEFSTFSHKVVYMNFLVGEEPTTETENHTTVMTQIVTSLQEIHRALDTVEDHQRSHRVPEAEGKRRADTLNRSAMLWPLVVAIQVLLQSILQVAIVRSFFSEKKRAPRNYIL